MTEPKFLSGPPLTYRRRAREREVEDHGRASSRPVGSTPAGCQSLRQAGQSSPPWSSAATPVTMGGRPIDVDYTFRIPFRLVDAER
jgi:hypothetical protein